jgi:type IV secretion system protein VirB10
MSTAANSQETPPASKLDSQSLVLRGRPRPAVRFRRGLVVGVSGAVAAGLAALAWVALEPAGLELAAAPDGSGGIVANSPAEALAGAPASYGDVPRLGPPLPGDLGQAILDRRRGLEPAGPRSDEDLELRSRQEADAAWRQQAAAAEQAARTAGLLVELEGGAGHLAGQPAGDVAQGAAARAEPASPGASTAGSGVGERERASTPPLKIVGSHPVVQAPSPWTLAAGTVIPASLVTGLNSDLPGAVIAQVTENVSDSATGRTVLIPQGARLIGRYGNSVAYGQRRAMLLWSRLVFPDGSSVQLDDMPAADSSGYAGVSDRIDSHGWQLLRGIALSTLLGVGTQLSLGSSESGLVRAVRESAQRNAADAGDRIAARDLDVQPTLTVRPGWPVTAIVNEDLVLEPWKE